MRLCRAVVLAVLAVVAGEAGCRRDAGTNSAPAAEPTRGPGSRPVGERALNLILISLDTLRADRLGCYGYQRPTSPHLDAWSQGAVLFTRAISLANETVASHQGLFQSKLPSQAMGTESRTMLAGVLKAAGYRTAAFTGGGPMSVALGFGPGFQEFDEDNWSLSQSVPKAIPWLEKQVPAGGGAPFFLFLHTFDVHLPYNPPPPYDTMFFPEYDGPVTGPGTQEVLRKVRRIFEWASFQGQFDVNERDRQKINALYDGGVAYLDAYLFRLFEALGRLKLTDRTMLVIFSDHGEEFWDHGSVLHAHTLYQELLHVPLIIRVPGYERYSGRVSELVSLIDVVPTILDALDIDPPDGLQGRSLLPAMRGEPFPPRPALSEGLAFGLDLQAIIHADFKLIRYNHLPGRQTQLYYLAKDPQERHDLVGELVEMRERLAGLLDAQTSPLAAKVPHPLDRLPQGIDAKTLQRLRALGYVE